MKNLSRNSTEEEILAVPLPEETDSYSPVSHKVVLDIIREEANNVGLLLNNPQFLTNKLGTRIIGMFDITLQDGHKDMGIRLAFRNSYDKSLSFKIVLGGVIFVCSNTCIGGEINYKRKHTGNAVEVIRGQIQEAFSQAKDNYFNLVEDAESFKTRYLNKNEIAYLLGHLFINEEVLTLTQLGIVSRELQESKSFKNMNDSEFSLFDFYNACTEALKTSHPNTYIEDHINLHDVLRDYYYE